MHAGLRTDPQEGMVLVTVMILSTIALVLMAALLVLVTNAVQLSGGDRRLAAGTDVAEAGAKVAKQMLDAQGTPDLASALSSFSAPATGLTTTLVDFDGTFKDCLEAKLENNTADWSGSCDSTPIIDEGDSTTYDMTYVMGTDPSYRVYIKIVDTMQGNTISNNGVEKSKGVVNSSAEIPVVPAPTVYATKVVAVAQTATQERGEVDLLYAY